MKAAWPARNANGGFGKKGRINLDPRRKTDTPPATVDQHDRRRMAGHLLEQRERITERLLRKG